MGQPLDKRNEHDHSQRRRRINRASTAESEVLYRVRVGAFATPEEAEPDLRLLKERGYEEAYVVKSEDGLHITFRSVLFHPATVHSTSKNSCERPVCSPHRNCTATIGRTELRRRASSAVDVGGFVLLRGGTCMLRRPWGRRNRLFVPAVDRQERRPVFCLGYFAVCGRICYGGHAPGGDEDVPIGPDWPITIYRPDTGETVTLDLESYLVGVVAAEMPACFTLKRSKHRLLRREPLSLPIGSRRAHSRSRRCRDYRGSEHRPRVAFARSVVGALGPRRSRKSLGTCASGGARNTRRSVGLRRAADFRGVSFIERRTYREIRKTTGAVRNRTFAVSRSF